MARPTVIFDFDGVLVDSIGIGLQVFEEFMPNASAAEVRSLFDRNVVAESRAYLERQGHTDVQDVLDRLSHRYVELAAVNYLSEHAKTAVRALADDHDLFVVTTSHVDAVHGCLDRSGMRAHFKKVYGYEAHPSKYEKIKMLFAEHGAVPEQSVFVTDTLGDIHEATAAGVRAIGVTWGLHDRARLEAGSPWAVLDDPQELASAIRRYFSAHGN